MVSRWRRILALVEIRPRRGGGHLKRPTQPCHAGFVVQASLERLDLNNVIRAWDVLLSLGRILAKKKSRTSSGCQNGQHYGQLFSGRHRRSSWVSIRSQFLGSAVRMVTVGHCLYRAGESLVRRSLRHLLKFSPARGAHVTDTKALAMLRIEAICAIMVPRRKKKAALRPCEALP